MVWLAGIAGFIFGFGAGLGILKKWVGSQPVENVIQDKALRTSYGIFVWMLAAISSAAAIWLYKYYF